jgi:tape measure domain-containing protein
MNNPKVQLLIDMGVNKLKNSLGKAKQLVDNGTAAMKEKLRGLEMPELKSGKFVESIKRLKRTVAGSRAELGGMMAKPIEAPQVNAGGMLAGLKNMRGMIVGALGVGAIAAGVGASLKAGLEGSAQKVSFQTMAGDKKGSKLYGDLTKFAQDSIFGNELYQNAQTMLSFGVSVDQVMPRLKMLGDVSMGNKEKLQSLSLAYSQIMATGRLMGQDLLQLINAGFNPLQIISEKTGVSMADLKDKMEKGMIGADLVTKAFEAATGEGGRFFNMTERIAKTPFGQWEAFKGQIQGIALQFGTSLLPIVSSIIPVLSDLAGMIPDLVSGFMPFITDVMGAIPPLIAYVVPLIKELSGLMAPIATELWNIGKMLLSRFMPIITEVVRFLVDRFGFALRMVGGLLRFVGGLIKFVLDLIDPVLKGIEYIFKGINSLTGAVTGIPKSREMVSSYTQAGGSHGSAYAESLNKAVKQKANPLETLKSDSATQAAKSAGETQGNAFLDGLGAKLRTFKYDLSAQVKFDTSAIKKFNLDAATKSALDQAKQNYEQGKKDNKKYGKWFNDNFNKSAMTPLPSEKVSLVKEPQEKSALKSAAQRISLVTKDMWEKMHAPKKLLPDKAASKDSNEEWKFQEGKSGKNSSSADSVAGSAQQARNITINFGSYIKGDVISQNQQISSMTADQLDKWLREHFQRLIHSVEGAY